MKNDREKIKTQANIGMTDPDWAIVQEAVKIKGCQQAEYLREIVLKDARKILARYAK